MITNCDLVGAPTAWHAHALSCIGSSHTAVSPQGTAPQAFLLTPARFYKQNHPLTNCDRHTNCRRTVLHRLIRCNGVPIDDQIHTLIHTDTNASQSPPPNGSVLPPVPCRKCGVRGPRSGSQAHGPHRHPGTHRRGACPQQTHRTMPNMTSTLPSSPTAHTAE